MEDIEDDVRSVEDLNRLSKEDLIVRHLDFTAELETIQINSEKKSHEVSLLQEENTSLKDAVWEMKEQIMLLSNQINVQFGSNSPTQQQW